MAQKEVGLKLIDVKLGDEFETGFMALANEREIKESGRLFLKLIGDQLERDKRRDNDNNEGERHRTPHHGETANPGVDRTQSFSRRLQRVVAIVDTVLEWLEHSGKNAVTSLKKQEMVLRGVFNLTGELYAREFDCLVKDRGLT